LTTIDILILFLCHDRTGNFLDTPLPHLTPLARTPGSAIAYIARHIERVAALGVSAATVRCGPWAQSVDCLFRKSQSRLFIFHWLPQMYGRATKGNEHHALGRDIVPFAGNLLGPTEEVHIWGGNAVGRAFPPGNRVYGAQERLVPFWGAQERRSRLL